MSRPGLPTLLRTLWYMRRSAIAGELRDRLLGPRRVRRQADGIPHLRVSDVKVARPRPPKHLQRGCARGWADASLGEVERDLLHRFGWLAAETLVLFESPRRVGGLLAELAEAFGERRACLARELTKLHEEAARGTLAELAAKYAEGARGEVTLVVEGARPGSAEPATADALRERVRALLAAGLSARDLASQLARETGAPRRTLYALALEESGR